MSSESGAGEGSFSDTYYIFHPSPSVPVTVTMDGDMETWEVRLAPPAPKQGAGAMSRPLLGQLLGYCGFTPPEAPGKPGPAKPNQTTTHEGPVARRVTTVGTGERGAACYGRNTGI